MSEGGGDERGIAPAKVPQLAGIGSDALAGEARFAASPELALGRLAELPAVERELGTCAREERIALLALLGASGQLSRTLAADPGWRDWLRSAMRGADAPPALRGLTDSDPTTSRQALRRWRQRAYLRIGARDLWGLAPIEETLEGLSVTADRAIDAAVGIARRELEAEYGRLEVEPGRKNRFAVLGMGKLGARELNYSSDVDLVFVHEVDGPRSAGGPRGALSTAEYCTRLAERLTRVLSEATQDGYVYRVDLRLRPDGANGPLTSSLAATLGYYESFGQTWERAALFKARSVGGDRDLGAELLARLEPFVFRRTLDYTMIADLEQMKVRVDEQVRSRGRGGRDVKLGPGGIREVEFLVQAFSLVHGGRDRRLREPSTLAALRLLAEVGLLDGREGEALGHAYRWLRRVEHALQIDEERQTHVLPDESGASEVVARRLGLHLDGEGPVWGRRLVPGVERRFEEIHARHTGEVQAAFDELFHSRRARTAGMADAVARDLIDDLDAPDVEARLAELGFLEPGRAAAALRSLRGAMPEARAESRRAVLALAPALLSAVRESANPDRALAAMADFLARVGARRTFTALLAENPGTLRLLVNLFATSDYLSRALIGHPELLDTLVRSDLATKIKTAAELEHELANQLEQAADFEERLDVLRRFRNDEMLRIGVHDILGELHYTQVSDQLSALADACLRNACGIALAERVARFGMPRGQGLAVVALGKLGSLELNYHSDLDLVFIHGPSPEVVVSAEAAARWESSGLEPHEFWSKVAQLLLGVLQLSTREGYVYKIDTRLRPSGRAGALVTSVDGFARYHAESSAVWERQALIRARVVCGAEPLARAIGTIIERFVWGRGLGRGELAEIARLRRRMERELAREGQGVVNLKTGRGGLVDIEFIAQALALAHGHERPELRLRATRRLLDALGSAGLLSAEDHAALLGAYAFLRGLENRLRIEGEHAIERITRDPAALASAARRMGIREQGSRAGALLLDEYDRQREVVRGIYDRLVGHFARDPALGDT